MRLTADALRGFGYAMRLTVGMTIVVAQEAALRLLRLSDVALDSEEWLRWAALGVFGALALLVGFEVAR
jgi:hypothetical protein